MKSDGGHGVLCSCSHRCFGWCRSLCFCRRMQQKKSGEEMYLSERDNQIDGNQWGMGMIFCCLGIAFCRRERERAGEGTPPVSQRHASSARTSRRRRRSGGMTRSPIPSPLTLSVRQPHSPRLMGQTVKQIRDHGEGVLLYCLCPHQEKAIREKSVGHQRKRRG